jgi:UPF0755 protein
MTYQEYDDDYEPTRGSRLWPNIVAVSSWLLSLAAVGLGAAFLLIVETQRPGPRAPSGQTETVIVIPRGASVGDIAEHLQAEGVVRSALAFRAGLLLYGHGRSLKAGEYAIPSYASDGAIIDKLAQGKVLLHPITAPEGWTSAQIVEMLAASDVLDGDTPTTPPEGALLPETYRVERGAERAAVLKQMREARDKLLAELWSKRPASFPLKTAEQAVILASIVEKETSVPAERARVAAVFLNRLRKGMKLESDPTVIYGVTGGKPLGHGITQSELGKVTPYNTYKIVGLPPTPISNPGRASLEAVLAAPATGELYFVADGSGGHMFAASLADHQKNVARWRNLERLRGAQ